jgi:DNA-directed RNA polymerase specialized sigma24 family protein
VRSGDSVRDAQAITRWLCTAARREAWRVSKAATRTRPVEDDVLAARMPTESSPESEVVTLDDKAALWAAITRLPERCQRLLRIVAWEPRPDYSSVADTLGMPIGSIGPTRRRCLDKLRIELGGAA